MKYKVTENENVSTVFLDGEIDMDVADNVREVVFPLIDSGKEVHLNLSKVDYMDSSGISVLIQIIDLFPFNSSRRFARNIINNSIN